MNTYFNSNVIWLQLEYKISTLMPKVPYPYEINGKLVTGNGSLIPICSLSNRSLLPSLTVLRSA